MVENSKSSLDIVIPQSFADLVWYSVILGDQGLIGKRKKTYRSFVVPGHGIGKTTIGRSIGNNDGLYFQNEFYLQGHLFLDG